MADHSAELADRWRLTTRSLERWRAEPYGPAWHRIGARSFTSWMTSLPTRIGIGARVTDPCSRGRTRDPAQEQDHDSSGCDGGQNAFSHPTFPEVALKLLDNGYEPTAAFMGRRKRPIPTGWTTAVIDEAQVLRWINEVPERGRRNSDRTIGRHRYRLPGPEIATQMGRIVEERTGASLMRVGLWPKRLYLVRTAQPFPRKSSASL